MENQTTATQKIIRSMKKDVNKPMTFSNWSFKKTFIGEWKQFLWWLLIMMLALTYHLDTKACRDMLENLDEICANYTEIQVNIFGGFDGRNISWEDNQSGSPLPVPIDYKKAPG